MKKLRYVQFCLIGSFFVLVCFTTSANDKYADNKVITKTRNYSSPAGKGRSESEIIGDEELPDVGLPEVAMPDILFEKPDYDFGEVYSGNKVEHIFRFKNNGSGELKISKARSSCGCTAAIVSSKNIKYNEYGEVKVTFNTQSRSGKAKKRVTIYSNDPDTPKYRLSIFGNILEEVVVKPKRVDFSRVPFEKGASKEISVTSGTDYKLKIEKVNSSNPNVITTFKGDESGYTITVSVKKETDYGRFNGSIFVSTNSKKQKKLTIPFYGEIIGDLSVYPPRISCGVIPVNKERVFPVFAILYNKDVKIEKVEATPAFIKTSIIETKSTRKTYKVETIISSNSPVGKISGELKIYTNSKIQPSITIPITGMIKKDIKPDDPEMSQPNWE